MMRNVFHDRKNILCILYSLVPNNNLYFCLEIPGEGDSDLEEGDGEGGGGLLLQTPQHGKTRRR